MPKYLSAAGPAEEAKEKVTEVKENMGARKMWKQRRTAEHEDVA